MLQGIVQRVQGARVVLSVQGVGYIVAIRSPLDFTIGDTVTLHTHLAVRENALDLYGFLLTDELHMFEELIKLPKIGPKSALQILIQADVPLLMKAIAEQDPVYLSKMSGIGKKTSEKIVAELKDIYPHTVETSDGGSTSSNTDIIDALVALGYPQKDARDALQSLPPEITDTNERIKLALRSIGSRSPYSK